MVREERGLVATGAASSGGNGFGSAFIQPVGEDCFGMRRGPAAGPTGCGEKETVFKTNLISVLIDPNRQWFRDRWFSTLLTAIAS